VAVLLLLSVTVTVMTFPLPLVRPMLETFQLVVPLAVPLCEPEAHPPQLHVTLETVAGLVAEAVPARVVSGDDDVLYVPVLGGVTCTGCRMSMVGGGAAVGV
jgi:hypothetical protein